MLERLRRLGRLPGRLTAHAKLLRDDPERLGRNLAQVTNPALFERRLIDVLHPEPMHTQYVPVGGPPRLNVLDTAWNVMGMTGGPNTVINLACRIAQHGVEVRLVSTVAPATIDPAWLLQHAGNLVGSKVENISVVSAGDAGAPLQLGPGDVFLATHWTTAQQLKAVLPSLPIRQFFYMLQEFEPGFYAWSSNYALAVETFGLDFWPIINEAVLAEFLLAQPLGRLAEPAMRERAIVFEPAVDTALFHPGPVGASHLDAPHRPRRLLFYARPTNSRNLFGMGLLALRRAAADPALDGWEFVSIGSRGSIPDLDLHNGHSLRRAPWTDYVGYGDVLRGADVLLCPMLSPHTSYPVLEMAACGGLSVTNTFATKTQAALEGMSHNIVAVEPTIEGLADGIVQAALRINAGHARIASMNMPGDWGSSLDPVACRVVDLIGQFTAPA